MKKILSIIIFISTFIYGNACFASFIGQQLELSQGHSTPLYIFNTNSFSVGSGIDVELYTSTDYPWLSFDFSESNLIIDYTGLGHTSWGGAGPDDFSGFVIHDYLNTLDTIIDVSLNETETNLDLVFDSLVFDQSFLTFDSNNIYINFAGVDLAKDTIISIDVAFVPLPPSLLLFLSGISGIFLTLKRPRSNY